MMKYGGSSPDRPSAEFWRMVDLAREDPRAFDDAIGRLDRRALVDLYWTYQSATGPLREARYIDRASPDLSEDGIDDLVTWIVAQGETYYRRVLEDAAAVPDEAGDWNNDLQGALEEEYDRRYGRVLPFPEDLPDEEEERSR
jgi:hypothetical protein